MLSIRMLGPFEVIADGEVLAVGGGRARSLLAILALSPGRAISSEALVERCWGEQPPSDPKASLHAAVRRLRVLLGDQTIRTTEYGYLLDIEPEDVDAVAFSRSLESVGEIPRERLEAALALWDGEPFAGDFCDWLVQTERIRLVELRLSAVERRADLDLLAGRATAVLTDLQDLTGRYPLRESLWVRYLRAMDACGRSAEAVEQYGVIRGRIADELGIEPGAELRRIFENLLAGEPVGRPVEPARLVPRQLPTDLPRFHGRVAVLAELDKIQARAARADAPTTTAVLHGQGGAGKTSLAVHWAHRASEDFPDGTFFVDLHGYGPGAPVEPAAALENLLCGLDLSADGLPSDVDGRSALLRSTLAGRRVLMVLDNARNEEQVRPLLPGAGALVLVTSRSRMRGLVARDNAESIAVEQLSPTESVELLASRIPRQDGDRQLLNELAQQCNQLPLALAIAAEQVVSRPERGLAEVVGELAERSDRLDALDTGDDPASDLRAVFSWSYQALEPRAARFFRLLGLNPVPEFDAPAAAALAGCSFAASRNLLRRLADLHLVGEVSAGRFQLHDLLRAYAAERAEQDESGKDRWDAEERLLEWFNRTVNAGRKQQGQVHSIFEPDPALDVVEPLRFQGTAAATAWFEAEGPSLAAVVTAFAGRDHGRQVAHLGVQLWFNLVTRSAYAEAITVQNAALRCAQAAGIDRLEAWSRTQLGTTYGALGKLDLAEAAFESALVIFDRMADAGGQSTVHCNLGQLHQLLGADAKSVQHLQISLDLSRQRGDVEGAGSALSTLATTHLAFGRYDAALCAAREALRDYHRCGDIDAQADALDTLAQIHVRLGHPDAAVRRYRRACDIRLAMGARASVAEISFRLGAAQRDAGDHNGAWRTWHEVLALIDDLNGAHVAVDRAEVVAAIAGLDPQ